MTETAILHAPSPNMGAAVRTFIDVEPIDLERVVEQHAAYRQALERAHVRVVMLSTNLEAPDAVFIEDTAVVLDEVAILASPGTPSRVSEVAGVEAELRRHREEVVRIDPPATLEGGDVLRVGRTLYVGAPSGCSGWEGRTNAAGLDALARIAGRWGYDVRRVAMRGCLHLKTGCTALPDGTMLLNPSWVDLEGLHVDPDEPGAANVVIAGGRVLMAAAFPRTIAKVRARGFEVDAVDLSEIAKAEGSATCLSLLFRTR